MIDIQLQTHNLAVESFSLLGNGPTFGKLSAFIYLVFIYFFAARFFKAVRLWNETSCPFVCFVIQSGR